MDRCFLMAILILGLTRASFAEEPAPDHSQCSKMFREGELGVYQMEDTKFLRELYSKYSEFAMLKTQALVDRSGPSQDLPAELPSLQLFQERHVEFDRTAVGLLALKWVLNGQYEKFVNPQPEANRLSRENFEHLQKWTKRILNTPEALEAMTVYLVINDLGLLKIVQDSLPHSSEIDHDVVLTRFLRERSELVPSFTKLSSHYQSVLLRGLDAKFNIGQLVQGENVAASLLGLHGPDQESLEFYLLHVVFDAAGARGHVNPNGSLLMTESTYQGFRFAIQALEGLGQGLSVAEVYSNYLKVRAEQWGAKAETPHEQAMIRLALLSRIAKSEQLHDVTKAFESLPSNIRDLLQRELSRTGTDGESAILLYWAPELVMQMTINLQKAGATYQMALQEAYLTLARLYMEARTQIKERKGSGVYTLTVNQLSKQAALDSRVIRDRAIHIRSVGADGDAELQEVPKIETSHFSKFDLRQFKNRKVVVIGIGGGSDGVQAAQLARILSANQIADVRGVISVRRSTQKAPVTIERHGGELLDGVYRVTSKSTGSTGSGRFMENLIAEAGFNTYLLVNENNFVLPRQLRSTIDKIGNVDLVIAVDTGGDSLYPAQPVAQSKATPDQDRDVLLALAQSLKQEMLTVLIAAGVDTPPTAQSILEKAKASYYELSRSDEELVLNQYANWRMDGSDEKRFGKTSLAWQAALRGEFGMQALPVPSKKVLDEHNPWSPFVNVTPAMRGIFFMPLSQHLSAVFEPQGELTDIKEKIAKYREAVRKILKLVDLDVAVSATELTYEAQGRRDVPAFMKTHPEEIANAEGWGMIHELLRSVGITSKDVVHNTGYGLALTLRDWTNGLANIPYFEEQGKYGTLAGFFKSLSSYMEKYETAPREIQNALDEGYNLVRVGLEPMIGFPKGVVSNLGHRFVAVHEAYPGDPDDGPQVARGIIIEEFEAGVYYLDENTGQFSILSGNKRKIRFAVVKADEPKVVGELVRDYLASPLYQALYQEAIKQLKLDKNKTWTAYDISEIWKLRYWGAVEHRKSANKKKVIDKQTTQLMENHNLWYAIATLSNRWL